MPIATYISVIRASAPVTDLIPGSRLSVQISGDHFVMPIMCEFACSAVSSGAVRSSGRSIAVNSSEQQQAVSLMK